MKGLFLLLALGGTLTGVYAAFLWWRASQLTFDTVGRMRAGGVDEALNDLAQWTLEISDILVKSNRMNKKAALWTAVSVGLNALATLASALA